MSNTITIELCAEDRKRIDELICFSGLLVGELKQLSIPVHRQAAETESPESPTAPQSAPEIEAVKSDHPVDEVSPFPEPVAEAKPEEVKPTITHEDIQLRVKKLIAHGSAEQNAAARKAVTSRARNISSLTAEQLEPVWAELVALGEPANAEG